MGVINMIKKDNFKQLIDYLGFSQISTDLYEKKYSNVDCSIVVDLSNEKINYPEDQGMKITHHTTCNFSNR